MRDRQGAGQKSNPQTLVMNEDQQGEGHTKCVLMPHILCVLIKVFGSYLQFEKYHSW